MHVLFLSFSIYNVHYFIMKFKTPISVKTLAGKINATLLGDENLLETLKVQGMNEVHHVQVGDITFSDHPKYFEKALKSNATFIILNEKPENIPDGKIVLLHSQPFEAYNNLVQEMKLFQALKKAKGKSAQIHSSVIIEPNAIIGERVFIDEGTIIGIGTIIYDDTHIGKNVLIGALSIIGSDAFYFKKSGDTYTKWNSCGGVVIEDNVDIGAGCTINKGVSSDTIIGEGTKLDCQVHIGHDTKIGKNCIIAAQTGISGNTVVEDDVVIYGQVGIAHNLHIGKGAVILAKSGVTKNVAAGEKVVGYPAQDTRSAYRELATLRLLSKKS